MGISVTMDEFMDISLIHQLFTIYMHLMNLLNNAILNSGTWSIVGKYGEAKVSLPGGCAIGMRPVDMHINALQKMEQLSLLKMVTHSEGEKIKRHQDFFPRKSVTGTENIIMAATLEKTTTIKNAASERDLDLCLFLNKMGAKSLALVVIQLIQGVDSLRVLNINHCLTELKQGIYGSGGNYKR